MFMSDGEGIEGEGAMGEGAREEGGGKDCFAFGGSDFN